MVLSCNKFNLFLFVSKFFFYFDQHSHPLYITEQKSWSKIPGLYSYVFLKRNVEFFWQVRICSFLFFGIFFSLWISLFVSFHLTELVWLLWIIFFLQGLKYSTLYQAKEDAGFSRGIESFYLIVVRLIK